MKAYVEVRSQKAKVGNSGFGGPDTYVAIQVVPAGAERLTALDKRQADKRGITIEYIGEGYHKSRGPRSALGQAIREAERRAALINLLNP